jgi:hypothetical protein
MMTPSNPVEFNSPVVEVFLGPEGVVVKFPIAK